MSSTRRDHPAELTQHCRMFGRYHLLGELGHGGMSDVFLASRDGSTDRSQLVVIKRLRNIGDPQSAEWFADEARIACRLRHPNLVRTFDFGIDDRHHFLVMEYLHGPTLRQLRVAARPRGGLPWPVEVTILSRVLEGLHHAHELRGLDGTPLETVHRDLSSENVIVTSHGEPKLLDFGIAKASDSISSTRAGVCRGKLRNMPPEQLRGEKVDRRADVYAAGLMLWEGLSGRSLWTGLTDSAIAARVVRGQLPELEVPGGAIPEALRAMCSRALARAPEARFPSAFAFAEALSGHLQQWRLTVSSSQLAGFIGPLFAAKAARIESLLRAQPQRAALRAPLQNWSARISTAIARRFVNPEQTDSFTHQVPTAILPARGRIAAAPGLTGASPAGRRLPLMLIVAASLIALSGYCVGQLAASRLLRVEVVTPESLPPRLPTGAPELLLRQEPPVVLEAAAGRRPRAPRATPATAPRIRPPASDRRRSIDGENPYRSPPERLRKSAPRPGG